MDTPILTGRSDADELSAAFEDVLVSCGEPLELDGLEDEHPVAITSSNATVNKTTTTFFIQISPIYFYFISR